jgi:hypothetical protein
MNGRSLACTPHGTLHAMPTSTLRQLSLAACICLSFAWPGNQEDARAGSTASTLTLTRPIHAVQKNKATHTNQTRGPMPMRFCSVIPQVSFIAVTFNPAKHRTNSRHPCWPPESGPVSDLGTWLRHLPNPRSRLGRSMAIIGIRTAKIRVTASLFRSIGSIGYDSGEGAEPIGISRERWHACGGGLCECWSGSALGFKSLPNHVVKEVWNILPVASPGSKHHAGREDVVCGQPAVLPREPGNLVRHMRQFPRFYGVLEPVLPLLV